MGRDPSRFPTIAAALLLVLAPSAGPVRGDAPRPFAIRVVDAETKRGVPLVVLRTVNDQVFVTDSAGLVAFDEPGLMGRRVFFHVESHGYEFPKDGFGYRGRALEVVEGGSAELEVRRINVAERLYRVTGGGIYRDSEILGREAPLAEPLLDAQVLGSDSVMNVLYGGKLLWFWGDTNRPSYPLGHFHMSAARSTLPADGGLDPAVGVDLDYVTGPDGFARGVCKMPGDGPTWMVIPTVLRDPETGRERLLAAYNKIKPPLETYRRGFCEWDDQAGEFLDLGPIPLDAPPKIDGHTLVYADSGAAYALIHNPYPLTRVDATPSAFLDIDAYESYTCLLPGSTLEDPRLDRDDRGRLRYAWRRGTASVGPGEQAKLEKVGLLKPSEGLFQLRDIETGKPVQAHSGSIAPNEFTGRWGMIAVQAGGSTSFLGEVWYAEADTPLGPWAFARKVVTHEKYTFYNPRQHPYFAEEGGRRIYFEGTYSRTFSGNPVPTPRYDYNQLMYRLDLADPRLSLPVPIYDVSPGEVPEAFGAGPEHARRPIAFFAPVRPGGGLIPVGAAEGAAGGESLPRFYVAPADREDATGQTVPLHEFRREGDGRRAYSVDPDWSSSGFQRVERPVGRVWRDPWEGRRPWISGGGG